MSAILNFLNAHNFPIYHKILMKLVSKSVDRRALSYKRYLSLRLRSLLSYLTLLNKYDVYSSSKH